MNSFILSALAALFVASSQSATQPPSARVQAVKDGSQYPGQAQATPPEAGVKLAQLRSFRINVKKMDSNGNGLISKAEYMTYHEIAYRTLKQSNDLAGATGKDRRNRADSFKQAKQRRE
jgi:hypothetical protein